MQKPRIGVHEVVEKIYEAIGEKEAGDKRTGTEIVAKFLGVGKTTAYKWSDPDQEGEISYARVRLLTEHFAITAAAEDLARMAGGEFAPLYLELGQVPWVAKLGAIARQDGILHGMIGDALSDGKIDTNEGRAILSEIDAHIEQMHRLRARVEEECGLRTVTRMTGAAR